MDQILWSQVPSILINVILLLMTALIVVQKNQNFKYKLIDNDLKDLKDFVKKEVSKRIKIVRKTNESIKIFAPNLIIGPTDKAAINFSFTRRNFDISNTRNEIGLNGTPNPTCEFSRKTTDEIIYEKRSLSNKFGLNPDKKKYLPIIY